MMGFYWFQRGTTPRASDDFTGMQFIKLYIEFDETHTVFTYVVFAKGTADAHLKILYEECVNEYCDEMHEAMRTVHTYCSEADLRQKHLLATEKAMNRVCSTFTC